MPMTMSSPRMMLPINVLSHPHDAAASSLRGQCRNGGDFGALGLAQAFEVEARLQVEP
jgi:hypothetical protein